MANRKKVCRLCFKNCGDFITIAENTIAILNILPLKINLAISKEPVICTNCMEALKKCFNFKSRCLYSQGYTFTFVHSKHSAKMDIKIVYLDKKKNDNVISTSDDQKVCRLCMAVLKRLILPHKEEGDASFEKMIEKCIPELQAQTVTKKHIICAACRKCLQNFFSFITNCEIVEETIKKYCEALGTNGEKPIDLNDILQLISKIVCEGDDPVYIIKTEETYCEDEENIIETELKDEHFMNTKVQMCNNELQFLSYDMVICEGGNGGDKVQENCCEEIDNEVEHIDDNFMEMENQKYNGEKKNAVTYEENINIDMIKVEGRSCEENFMEIENQFNRELQENCCEGIESEMKDKNENIVEETFLPNEEIVIKTEPQEFDSFRTAKAEEIEIKTESLEFSRFRGSILPQSEVAIKIRGGPKSYKLYQCECCSYQTRKSDNFKSHTLVHKRPSEVTMYQCEYCLYQTKYKNNLKQHFTNVHGNLTTEKGNPTSEEGNPTKEKIYQCKSCLYKTSHKQFFEVHMLIHKKPLEVNIYQCESCSYQTNYRTHLTTHLMGHKELSEMTVYQCKSCSYQTHYRSHHIRHSKVHKKPWETTMYQCEYCAFQTKYKSSYKNHLERQHGILSEKKICQLKSFQSSKFAEKCEDHQRHMPTHKEPSNLQSLIKTNFKKIFETV